MNTSSSQTDLTSQLALDVKGMGDLRKSAQANSPAAMKTAATQFEAMFVNMMMKSMRDATPQDGLTDSSQSKMFTSMLDQQTSQNIAKKGIGLADMLMRQLSKTTSAQALAVGDDGAVAAPSGGAAALDAARLQRSIDAAGGNANVGGATGTTSTGNAKQPAHVREFQHKLAADADAASQATGIPAKFMLGQAALESGWGKREIKGSDGKTSHNLFGIKAGPDWKGKTVSATTTEYVNGKAQSKVEKFRAYDSYSDSFKDYASVLASNPRYQKVLASGGDAASFAQGLQRAGYATDPQYASKLTSIIKHSLA
ncbi:flagellar assembly peptidoglycan hydrolase FlgJ [Rugamonas sp.]|uniref:flagellar assembly peptidoglycan hydrolase FlgJ n=1 Tax=Rugamonas sp. TaxID=1926287 RepID=UPI0025EF9F6F|nr:flagellar assembly peptidoglycan hydrolase FlgJ [Rugamonas sp.]